MLQKIVVFLTLAVLVSLSGCASNAQRSPISERAQQEDSLPASNTMLPAEQETEAPEMTIAQPASEAPRTRAMLEPGTGQFINLEAAQRSQPSAQSGGEVVFNFEGEAIQAVVKAILGDLLQENYVIAPGVQGTVTFSTAKPIKPSQALGVLEMLLAWNNAALVYKDGRYTVLPTGQAIPGNLTPKLNAVEQGQRGYLVQVVPLKYIAPTEMEKILQPYAKPGAIVKADNARAMLVLAGTPAEIRNYLETVEIFDVNWLQGMSIGIFTLERVDAATIVPELEKLFGDGGATPLAGMFRFMPIERLNAVMVITQQREYLAEAERWLSRLDRGSSEGGTQLYVYYVKNVKAQDLADNLADVFGGGSSSRSNRNPPAGAVVPGARPVEVSSSQNRTGQDRQPAERGGTGGGGISIGDGEDIRITSVEDSNALMIRATPMQYESVMQAIKRLDIVPLQVMIEAQVIEVSLTGNLEFGVSWFFNNSLPVDAARTSYRNNRRPNSNAWNSFAGSWAGPSGDAAGALSWTFLNTSAEAVISALAGEGTIKLVSAPSLVVLNNKEATINVGQQIPVAGVSINQLGGGTDPNGGGFQNNLNTSYQYRDTGTMLSVTPRVNPGGLVFMEISQEQSAPGPAATAGANPPVNRRNIETEVAVQSGQTVVLGGLIQETNTVGQTGIPGLMRIPLIGRLFSSSTKTTGRTELLVLITPRVIDGSKQAQETADEYRSRFIGISPFVKELERKKAKE